MNTRKRQIENQKPRAEGKNGRDVYLESLRRVLSTEDGFNVLSKILENAHVYNCSFSSDALVMACSEGKRSLGLQIISDIEQAQPGAYPALLEFRHRQTLEHKLEKGSKT